MQLSKVKFDNENNTTFYTNDKDKPNPLKSILWPIIDPILVTFGQIGNFCYPNLVTFYFNELTHCLDWMKNTSLSFYSTNILECLLTVNMNCLTPKNRKMCDLMIVNPVVKMWPIQWHIPLASYNEVPSPP